MTTRLHLIRHGETEAGREGRAQGHTAVGLNDNGRRQALHLAEALAGGGQELSGLYSSDLPRARETAEVVAAAFPGLAVSSDTRLREKDAGG
ncbi:MAG: histidine phosphatase family protein, partial [Bacillota bacterium]